MTDPRIPALLDELQSIARTGLAYTRDPFDRERYQRLAELAAGWYGEYLDVPPEELRRRWAAELGQITPKVGAEAAVFDAAGRILLIHRADDGCWGLPGGWLEVNESPAEAAVRETEEETGLGVRVDRLVDVYTRRGLGGEPQATVGIVYLCSSVGGAMRPSHESLQVAYLPLEAVDSWHGWHREHAEDAYRLWRAVRPRRPSRPTR